MPRGRKDATSIGRADRADEPARRAAATPWRIDLHVELSGWLTYTYRHLRIERTARRASAREFVLALAYDEDLELVTRPRDLVRQRGRLLELDVADRLWRRLRALKPERLEGSYPCLDHMEAAQLDGSVGIDGEPIAVSTGEEGPACLTLSWGAGARARRKRIVIDRFREPPAHLRDGAAPLASICALVDAGLKREAPFSPRRTQPSTDLALEFEGLKALCFLNLRHFERRAVEALGSLRDGKALPSLTGELFAPDAQVRLQALDALAAIGDGSAADDVELLTWDDEGPVREKARHVLERLKACDG
ncbi:MAG: HEAT repeat domain-containing protein [Planctomycetota bacterium]|nr:HEAT repeat domain-containing protein [Planctomycetota bacterium]